jgi:hypothetical protein
MRIDFQPERRSFLGKVVVSVGGIAAGSLLPASLLQASPACIAATDLCGDWTLDDICTAYPPYAFQRDAAQPRDRAACTHHVDPLDALFAT